MALPERYGSWKTVYSRFRSWGDRVYLSDYSKNLVTLLAWKIQAWIQSLSGLTRRLRVQKNAYCLTDN